MTLKEFIDRDFGGNLSAFAARYKANRSAAWQWREGKAKPQLKMRERLKRKGVHFPPITKKRPC
jgi:hypothetical protein